MDAQLQSVGGGGPPKWDPQAHLRIYISHSPSYSGSFVLVMNPNYGFLSPKSHLVFDENFETVPHLRDGTIPENWEELVANSKEKSIEGFYGITKKYFEGEVDKSADPQAADNHQTSSSAASQKNGVPTSSS